MKQRRKPATVRARAGNVDTIVQAVEQLREARRALRSAGAMNAAEYAQRALKSAEGAERHARRMLSEALDRCSDCGDRLSNRTMVNGRPAYCETCDREVLDIDTTPIDTTRSGPTFSI